jgi:hypothetical protein|tara:strand:- start:577 stop:756 length:180 start_codon:yes stop_codon:yes gene_type:complete
MKLIRKYKDFTTIIEEYRDEQGNEFHYEDGELKYTNINFEEIHYDSMGCKYNMSGEEIY